MRYRKARFGKSGLFLWNRFLENLVLSLCKIPNLAVAMVQLNNIKDTLALFKIELEKRYPIASLGLFGSVVRDDFTENSDIDIVVTFTKPIGSDFILLAEELEDKLKRKVDLVSRAGIKEKYLRVIDPEIIYV